MQSLYYMPGNLNSYATGLNINVRIDIHFVTIQTYHTMIIIYDLCYYYFSTRPYISTRKLYNIRDNIFSNNLKFNAHIDLMVLKPKKQLCIIEKNFTDRIMELNEGSPVT